ncbi:MAG: DUF4097 family beta strand repeat-containing protein [Gemmatimonadota bacterium]|jgi:hypothetical protein
MNGSAFRRLLPAWAALAGAIACAATLVTLPAGGAVASPPPSAADPGPTRDTTLVVARGDTLVLADLGGELVLDAWDRDEVRATDLDEHRRPFRVRRADGRLELRVGSRDVELRLELPSWLPVVVRGHDLDVEARGLDGFLQVRTLEGDVFIRDVTGRIDVHALDGEISAEDVAGDMVLRSVNDDVDVRGARGRLRVESTDGDLTFADLDVESLDATTTDGDVRFQGAFRQGGSYALVTHSGDVTVEIPDGADLVVFVSTFDGELEAGFPITLDRIQSGRETRFTLGRGTARLSLEAFDGDIMLRRPGGL